MKTQSAVVEKLEVIFDNNNDLKEKFSIGFRVQPSTSIWKDRTIEDFYPFFENWLVFNPRLESSKEYVDKFSEFYVLPNHQGAIPEARNSVRDKRFADWLKEFVIARGEYLDSGESVDIVTEWAKENAVSIGQYKIPAKGFSSFNEFFSRELQEGVRPIYAVDNHAALISPADCDVWKDSGWLSKQSQIEVKGDKYDLACLIGDDKVSNKYINGSALVCFLMPDNYHRFHSPVTGKVTYRKDMDGLYFGTKGFVDYFHERRRSVLEIKMNNAHHVAVVSVGIATISSVELFKNVGNDVRKGDEIGKFEFGGSALVLLFEPNTLKSVIFEDALKSYKFRSTRFMMGQLLGWLG